MEKRWRNLLALAVLLVFVVVVISFLLSAPEKTTVTASEGFSQISSVLLANSLSFEKLQKAEIILVENGQLKNDFSDSSFTKLETGLRGLKTEFLAKDDSAAKNALVKSVDLYLELILLEKKEKELFVLAASLERDSTDLQTTCRNRARFVSFAQQDLELSNSLIGLNDKTNEMFTEFGVVEQIELLLLDIDTGQSLESYSFISDIEELDYACSILLDSEETQ